MTIRIVLKEMMKTELAVSILVRFNMGFKSPRSYWIFVNLRTGKV